MVRWPPAGTAMELPFTPAGIAEAKTPQRPLAGKNRVLPRQAVCVYVVVVCCFYVGGNLLSHTLPSAVPSARAGLASGFGMGPGVSLPLSTTDKPPGLSWPGVVSDTA